MTTESLIEIEGCLKAGVEAGCIILHTPNKGAYSLHGESLPEMGKGLGVRAKGTTGGVSICTEGTPFQVTSWEWTRQRCPK
jgi:hypothetical protein